MYPRDRPSRGIQGFPGAKNAQRNQSLAQQPQQRLPTGMPVPRAQASPEMLLAAGYPSLTRPVKQSGFSPPLQPASSQGIPFYANRGGEHFRGEGLCEASRSERCGFHTDEQPAGAGGMLTGRLLLDRERAKWTREDPAQVIPRRSLKDRLELCLESDPWQLARLLMSTGDVLAYSDGTSANGTRVSQRRDPAQVPGLGGAIARTSAGHADIRIKLQRCGHTFLLECVLPFWAQGFCPVCQSSFLYEAPCAPDEPQQQLREVPRRDRSTASSWNGQQSYHHAVPPVPFDYVEELTDAWVPGQGLPLRGLDIVPDHEFDFDAAEIELNAGGSQARLSIGSRAHGTPQCKPCLFWYRGVCIKGQRCAFCHLPHPLQEIRKMRPSKKVRSILQNVPPVDPGTASSRRPTAQYKSFGTGEYEASILAL